MLPALWVAKTGLSAQDMNLTTISNNLANVSTTGFKRDRADFEDLLYQIRRQPGGQSSQDSERPTGLQLGTGVRIAGTQKIFTAGSLQTTEQPLDMAVNGRGFFQILQPDGTVGYTRDGSFHLDSDGQIVTSQGFPLEPAIVLPAEVQTFTVGEDGTVSVTTAGNPAAQVIGNIQTADFVNPAGLQAIGNNLFLETASSGAPQVGTPGLTGLGTAPVAIAFADPEDDARLQPGNDRSARLRIAAHVHVNVLALAAHPRRGDGRALARKQRLVDPAFRAVGIADAAPVIVFLDDLDRYAGFQVAPGHRIIDARADTQVDALRLQADETRQRQAARPLGRLGMGRFETRDGEEDARKGGEAETHDKVTHGKSAQICEGHWAAGPVLRGKSR